VEKKKLDDVQVKLRNQIETLNDTITKLERINSDILLDSQTLNKENIILKKVNLHSFCHTHTHTRARAHTHTHTHTHTHAHSHTRTLTHTHAHAHAQNY